MKILIAYYSFEGATEKAAKRISEGLKADLMKIQPKNERTSHGFMKFFWLGKQAMMKESPELLPFEKNPGDYDVIIVGTPVWAFTLTPPVRSFLKNVKLQGKKIALFCTHEGGCFKTLAKMEELLPGNTIIGKKDFVNPKKSSEEEFMKKVDAWIAELQKAIG